MELVPLLGASIVAWLAQPGYCSIAQTDCEVQCRRSEGPGAKHGAIAFSPSTNAWGDSHRHGSQAEADEGFSVDYLRKAMHK